MVWHRKKYNSELFKNLPINKESDTAIELIKNFFLSNAKVPKSNGEIDLILIRINKLIELGDFDNAKSLIDLVNKKIMKKF